MRIAIIDLGTNTFNILIVEIDSDKTASSVFQTKLPVKLGEGGINANYIQPEPFQRGIRAFELHHLTIERYNVDRVYAFATSAIREASNGKEFVAALKQATGYDIEIIDGDREAELIYLGVRKAVRMHSEPSLIVDIGGGSTEFVIANKDRIFWKKSFLLGAARLLEKFQPSDPITDAQIDELWTYLRGELLPLKMALEQYPVAELIGSSGSFDSLAEMVAHRFYEPELLKGITEYTFKLSDCEEIYGLLLKSTKEERIAMKGLVEMRVDMIVVSSILVHFVLQEFGIEHLRLSTYALKEGVLQELISSGTN